MFAPLTACSSSGTGQQKSVDSLFKARRNDILTIEARLQGLIVLLRNPVFADLIEWPDKREPLIVSIIIRAEYGCRTEIPTLDAEEIAHLTDQLAELGRIMPANMTLDQRTDALLLNLPGDLTKLKFELVRKLGGNDG